MREAWIIDAVRTPIGRYGGALAVVRPDDLAAHAVRAVLERTGLESAGVEDVILGCANQAGEDNRNVARMAVLLAGLPVEVPGRTVNRLCGSGLQAVNDAFHAVRAGEGDVFVAGGVESMSRAPWELLKPADSFPRGVPEMADTVLGWRFVNPRFDPRHTLSLGETAEVVAQEYGVSREDQDRFALESQRRAAEALAAGRFRAELVPVSTPQRKGPPLLVEQDEHPRPDTTLEKLSKLPAAFRKGGTVTAGNSSGLNDGAAALLVVEAERARALALRPLARIVASAVAGVAPERMGMGPVPASRKALERAGLGAADLALVELNEAFASQSLACVRELGLDPARVNVNGGAIALGHPIGCSGARIVTTLVHEMARRGTPLGLATLCVSGGLGVALELERA